MTSVLRLENLAVGYRRKALATNINLDIKPKEFVTVMGENGCGKSTLIDSMIGNLEPLEGRIRFWDQENRGAARDLLNRQIGWVISQRENFPLFMKINELFKLIAAHYPTWNWRLCEKLCREFELDTRKRLFHLSLGEHSKVRLVKALSFEPKLIILDELTANLSPKSRDSLVAALLDLFAEKDEMSILYISHSKEEAQKLSDRIYEMKKDGLHLIGGQNV